MKIGRGTAGLFISMLLYTSQYSNAGMNPREAEEVNAGNDPAIAVRLESNSPFFVITVHKLLNEKPPTNGNPPMVQAKIGETLRGPLPEGITIFVWNPWPVGTIDWVCNKECRQQVQQGWERSEAESPTPDKKYIVCGSKKGTKFFIPAYCRFPASAENLRAVMSAIHKLSGH